MKEVLVNAGWLMYYSCNCGGTYKEYYSNKSHLGYEVRIKPKRQTFTILNMNHIIAGPDWGYNLQKKLKANGIGD